MTFKPKRTRAPVRTRAPASEIAQAVQSVAVPVKPVEATPAPITLATPATPAPQPEKTVQINFRASLGLAKIIDQLATKEGSTRAVFARLIKEAGYDVPDADLKSASRRRVYE
jgi:copper chaperone CopZ